MAGIGETILGDDKATGIFRLLIIVLGGVVLGFLYLFIQFKGLNSAEAMDQAQLARNIAEGKGYVTDNIRPLSLWIFQQNNKSNDRTFEAHPDIVNAPAYPCVLAGWLNVWSPKYEIPMKRGEFELFDGDLAAAVLGCVLFVIGILCLFFWICSMVDLKVATLVVALAGFSDDLWQSAISGTAWSLLFLVTVLMGWVLYARVRSEGEGAGSWIATAALGILLGAGFLIRFSYAIWLVPVLLCLLLHGGRARVLHAILVVVIAAAVGSPWVLRNAAVCGEPFGLAGYAAASGSDVFPGVTLFHSSQPDFANWTVKSLGKKWFTYATQIMQTDLKLAGGNWMIAFFLASCFFTFRREEIQRMKWFTAYAILAFVAILPVVWTPSEQGMTTQQPWTLVAPFVFVFGAVFFMVLLDRLEIQSGFLKGAAVVAFVAFNSFGLLNAVLGPRPTPFRYPPYYPPFIARASEFLKKEPVSVGGSADKKREWMMTDMPWAVAWYGRRPACGLTYQLKEMLRIHDSRKEFTGVFLTPVSYNRNLMDTLFTGELKEWMPLLVYRQAPTDFPLKGAVPMAPEFLLLTDPARIPADTRSAAP